MRIGVTALAALVAATISALAANAEGTIQSVDNEKMTITLDDGKTYKLPAEMDMSGIETGLAIVIAYDVVNGVNQITDMAFSE